MTAGDRERFAALCQREEQNAAHEGTSIGTYGEKRLHRILKAFVSPRPEDWEIPVGSYVADVLCEGRITEIQTGSLRPLVKKLQYYLRESEYSVTLLLPVVSEKTIVRMDRETGEVLHARRSPKKLKERDVLPELYWIGESLPDPRLEVRLLWIRAEEHRFSERMRYRKQGAYDAELYPKEILGERSFRGAASFLEFLPEAEHFYASEYSRFIGLKGRKLYSCLNFLCSIDLLEKEQEGRRILYHKKNK